MPFALLPHLAPYSTYVRPLCYYVAWTVYLLSFAVSPGLVTTLQVVCLVLNWILPRVEVGVERGRARLAAGRWMDPQWTWPDLPPGQLTPVPQWMGLIFGYVDVRWALAMGWTAFAVKLRAFSRWMGWATTASRPAAAPRRESVNCYSQQGGICTH